MLLKKQPPKGRRLLIIATTSRREVLDQMEMIPAFTDILHVPNLSTPDHLMKVVKHMGVISPQGMEELSSKLAGRRANIGVKKLIDLLDMVSQMELNVRASKLIAKLEDEMFISYPGA